MEGEWVGIRQWWIAGEYPYVGERRGDCPACV